jgi:hypothetical protein
MAERRMFAKTIIDSDAFLDMPLSTQALYFHLSMRADDDGFINNTKKIQRMLGCADDDLKVLLAKNFIIPFETGVCVIKHWKIHNLIQKDRYKETVYKEEKSKMSLKNNNVYTMDTEGLHDVSKTEPQVRLGKVSLGEDVKTLRDKSLSSQNSKSITLKSYLELCKQQQTPALDPNDIVFANAKKMGIDSEWLKVCWLHFKEKYVESTKKYSNWRLVFNNCVKDNYYKIWAFDENNTAYLTSTGRGLFKLYEDKLNG